MYGIVKLRDMYLKKKIWRKCSTRFCKQGKLRTKRNKINFFPTPTEVGIFLCDLAELDSTTSVIEPECGRGDLADVIWARSPKSLLGIENNLEMQPFLCHKPYQVLYRDFLEIRPGELETDRFIMNPPFSHQQDIKHVLHAFELLKPGGILVSVISESVFYLEWKVVKQFREFMQDKGAVNYKLESGTFKASGTMIPTRVIKIRKDKSTTNENIPSGTPAAH